MCDLQYPTHQRSDGDTKSIVLNKDLLHCTKKMAVCCSYNAHNTEHFQMNPRPAYTHTHTESHTHTYRRARHSCWASSRWRSRSVRTAPCYPSWMTWCLRGCGRAAWQLSPYCDLAPPPTTPHSPAAAPVGYLRTEEGKSGTTNYRQQTPKADK